MGQRHRLSGTGPGNHEERTRLESTALGARAELGGDPEPVSNIEIYVGLKPVAEWTTAETRAGLERVM